MECENCGHELEDDPRVETHIGAGWIEISLTCGNCEAKYSSDIQICYMDRID